MEQWQKPKTFSQFLTEDPDLLVDLHKYISSRAVELGHRLDKAVCNLKAVASTMDPKENSVADFISRAVHCLIHMGTSSKASRGVEQLLLSMDPFCHDVIKAVLKEKWKILIEDLHICPEEIESLHSVSGLLEHSKLVQKVAAELLPALLQTLGCLFQSSAEPSAVGRHAENRLQVTVKISLQLLQLFPSLRTEALVHLNAFVVKFQRVQETERLASEPLAVVISSLGGILLQKCFARDVTQLAGTAVAMVINAAPTPEESLQCCLCFYAALRTASPLQGSGRQVCIQDPRVPAGTSSDSYTAEIAFLRSIIVGLKQDVLWSYVTACAFRAASMCKQDRATVGATETCVGREVPAREIVSGDPLLSINLMTDCLFSTEHHGGARKSQCSSSDSDVIGARSGLTCPTHGLTCPTHAVQPFFILLFPSILDLCDMRPEYQYLAFHLLSIWYQKLSSFLAAVRLHQQTRERVTISSSTGTGLQSGPGTSRHRFMAVGVCSSSESTAEEVLSETSVTPSAYHKNQGEILDMFVSRTSLKSTDQLNPEFTVQADITSSKSGSYKVLTSKGSQMLSETMRRIWVNWDSPVEGVGDLVLETFRTLLAIWNTDVNNGWSDYPELAEELAEKVINMPWFARTRYKPLCVLVPYINASKFLDKHERLKSELLDCMRTSFLTSLASDVYTAFLKAIRDSCNGVEQSQLWADTWMNCVISGLTDADRALRLLLQQNAKTSTMTYYNAVRNKVCAYWLPATLTVIPETQSILQQHLQKSLQDSKQAKSHSSFHTYLLYAWMAICRCIRTIRDLDLNSLPRHLLIEALVSDDEDICAEALSLLAVTHKKAEPMGETEISLLRMTLPFCLKVDSAPFRQKLLNSLKKLFVRIRNSCMTAIKQKKEDKSVDRSLEWMGWMLKLLMTNIKPGACFQRRRTCLDIIQGWLETMVFVESDNSRKGRAKAPTNILLDYARTKNIGDFADFLSMRNQTCLLQCVTDGADEIQESAFYLLCKYYAWVDVGGQRGSAPIPHNLGAHLLQHGLTLCNSPRPYENRSGALLIRLVYQKFVREHGRHFQLQGDSTVTTAQLPTASQQQTAGDEQTAAFSFVSGVLLKRLETSFQVAQENVLLASRLNPIHGTVQALTECLQLELRDSSCVTCDGWQGQLQACVKICTAIITQVLNTLARSHKGSCPSFAEMGAALDHLLSEENSGDNDGFSPSISPEFQLLLSWCWLNLKECCSCLGVAAALAAKQEKNHGKCTLDELAIKQIADTFCDVLTHCRHRGAIEGCRSGFLLLCSSLMSCKDDMLTCIPASILHKTLVNIEKDEMTASVTRRSAGLPIIIQTIIQAERLHKSCRLLHETVSRLYSVASKEPKKQELDQKHDLAQVHALNVLKVLFSDASLAADLLQHVGNMMQLVICCFESSFWAIRNSATQLISILVMRMFGQRNKASLNCNTMTLQEWSAHFPDLLTFVQQKLERDLRLADSITGTQPSLFVVLTLLASLGPSSSLTLCHSATFSLRTTVMMGLSSPVYFVRELSATAVVALTPLDTTMDFVNQLLSELVPKSPAWTYTNRTHGIWICLEKLITARSLVPEAAETIVHHVINNKCLSTPAEQCLLVCAKCVDVLAKVVHFTGITDEMITVLQKILDEAIFSHCNNHLEVGQSVFLKSAASLMMKLLLVNKGSQAQAVLQDFVKRCFSHENVDLRLAVTECILKDRAHLECQDHREFLINLTWDRLVKESDATCMISLCQFLTLDYIEEPPYSCFSNDPDVCNIDLSAVEHKFGNLAKVHSLLLPVKSIALSLLVKTAGSIPPPSLQFWSDCLLQFSQPYQNEDLRMAAAQSLYIAGQPVLEYLTGLSVDRAIACLIDSCLLLLDDTDSGIRKVATHFVARLEWAKKPIKASRLNTNLCFKMFLQFLCDKFEHSQTVYSLLLRRMYTPGELHSCLQRINTERTQYLFEHEENTFYTERILQQEYVFDILKGWSHDFQQSSDSLHHLLTEFKEGLTVICSSSLDHPVFNISGEASVMAAVTGLVLQIHLISNNLLIKVDQELDLLLKIEYLHPFYQTLFSR